MADFKYRTGASATVTKSKSLEEKLAGIMGTSTGNIKKLESQLRREREAEEARKKAEEEARKRAEAAAAANAAAQRQAELESRQKLASMLKSGGSGAGNNAGRKYAAVELGGEQAKQGVSLTEYTLEQARADREARERAAAANQSVYDAYSGNSYVDETDTQTLETMRADAQTRLDVASDAQNKNRAYIEKQEQTLNSLINQIRAIQPALATADDATIANYNEMVRKYNVELDLYNQAVQLSGKRQTQFSERLAEYKTIENTIERERRIAEENAIRYAPETGETMQADIAILAAQLETLRQTANGYRRAHNPAMAEAMDEEIAAVERQLADLRTEYATWKGEAFGYDMEKTLSGLSADDLRLVDQLLADTRDVGAAAYELGMRDVFGDFARAEQALLAKYTPEQLEKIKEYRARQLREEQTATRAEEVRRIVGDSGLTAAALSVGSVLSNFVSAPLSIADVTIQALTNPTMPLDFNRRAMAAQNLTTDIRTAVTEKIDNETAQMLYATLMSGLDSVVASGLPGNLGGAFLGMTAASSTMQDVTERGGTLEQAIVGGVAAGVFEGFFESFSIGQLKAFDETAVASMRDFAQNILKSTLVNASEEAATEIANICFDVLAMGSVSNYETGIRELMAQGLTESQAKKAMAQTLATQIAESAASGALMGLFFGAGGSLLSFANDAAGIRYTQAYLSALQLPEDQRPAFTYRDGETSLQQVNEYGRAVYAALQEYNKTRKEERDANPEAARDVDAKAEELGAVQTRTVARAEDVLAAEEAGRAAADAEASANTDAAQTQQEPVAAAPVQQAETAAVTPQEVRNVRAVSNVQTAQNTPVSFDTDDVSAFVAEEAAEIYESLSMYEGTMRDSAVEDEARALRREGREDVAAALEQIHRDGGVNYGDSIGQRSERDAGESAGGEAGTVAESAGSDQGRDVQTGREETGRAAREDYETGRKIKLSAYGIRGVAENQTLTEITDTSSDPEIIEITNAAKLAGVEVHVVREQIRTKTGKRAGGTYENGVIIVSTSDPTFTPTQLFNHELFHATRENTPGLLTETTQLLLDSYTDAEFDALVAAYQQLYAGLDLEDEDIFEEICADMYAGMIREQYAAAREANLPSLTGEARHIVRERANVSALGESDANGTRAGPKETKTAAGSDAGDGRYSFAGVRAKNADREALQQARQMKEDGADAAEIFRETGWFVGSDDKWRFEIDDSVMSLRQMDVIPTFTRLEELIDAPMLFEAYPDLADMEITFQQLDKGVYGEYNRQFDDIALAYTLKNDESALLSSLAHEIQHAIQARERFARGASVEYWSRRIDSGFDARTAEERRKAEALRKEYVEIRKNDPEFFNEMKALTDMTPTIPRAEVDWNTLETIGEDPIEWQEFDARRDALEEKYGSGRVFDFMGLQYELRQSAARSSRSATDLYYDTAGEIEARDSARRRTLTAEERRQRMPDTGNEDTVFAEGGTSYAMNAQETQSVKEQIVANQDTLNKMQPVALIKDNGWKNMNKAQFREKIIQDLKKKGFSVDRQGFGKIELTEKELNTSLDYMETDAEAVAYQAIHQVLKRGIEIHDRNNHKARGYGTITFAAPVVLNGKRGNMAVVVKQTGANRYKVHRILTPEGKAFVLPEMANAVSTSSGGFTDVAKASGEVDPDINTASDQSIADSRPSVKARFSISDDTVDTLNTQLEETEQEIDRLEALMDDTFDATLFLQIDEAKARRSAIYEELRERHARAARQAARENDERRAAALEEIRLIEDHAKELSREASAERAAYKADGDAQHLANAERLRNEAAAERAKAKPMRERAGIEDKREFRPIESKRQTTNRILDLFKIQAGRRAEMRRDLNVILDRTLLQGYVTDSDLESLLRAMYDAGVDVVQPDAAYEDVAKTVRGTTLYISEEVRREFGDDWREMQRALTRAGIKTSLNSSERGVDSLYSELAEGYPGLFDGESTDMRAMLEDIVEAAQLGKAQHRSLADAAQEIGLSSDEDFAALYSEVRAELRSFADRADMEVRFRENLLKDTNERNAQRLQAERERFDAKLADLRKTYADSARRASERRQRSEQMTKIRNALKRLNRASERNDQTLTKILSRQTPEVQQLMNRVRDEISTVANRLTDRKLNNLLELKQLYEDRKANDPNFIPNPATEKALERVGMVHLNDLSVEDLQALYDTVMRIAHDFDEENQLIGEGMDQQLDNAGMEMIDEIEFAKGSSAKGNTALWLNERSLSPSRALLRYVGYDRTGVMGKLVESFEKGDIDAMGYTLGADMIFKEFVGRADVHKWLKTAAGENAEMIELEVPRILEWGEGDTPIFDQKNGEIIKDKVYLTKMMVVNMARDMKNEQNLWHIKYGGYTFPDAKLYKKGELQEAYARSNSKAVRMSPEFVQQVVKEHLDGIGKEYVELLDQYYDQFSKEKVNGVSRQLDGVDKAISDSYNPIRTSKAFRAQNYNVFDGTIEGMGSLKNRQHFAGNPIVLADADETMRWHRDNMARYVGYAIPMRNFKALMNYSKSFGEETIRAQIETKYGANAGKFLDEFAKIIEEGKLSESEGFTALDKLTGKYVSRVLGFNISSMLKQLSALSTAGTSHGFGVVNHALATPRKVDVELIRKYTPYYDYRGAGYTYTEVANLVRDTNAQQSKALQAILGKNWLEATDLWVNRRLWLAAEYVVQKRGLRPGTQAEIDAGRDSYYKAVAEVFNRMTHDTQTNYNTMSRPIALRSTNLVVRMATMFKTDALQLQGIARESFGAYQTAKRKFEDDPSSANRAELQRQKQKFINGAVGIVSASIMQSILEMVAKLVRGDDDDYRDENGKLTLGAAGKEIAKDTLYSLVGCVIFGDQIADMISALVTDEMLWEPDIPSVSALYDMYEDIKAFGEQAGEIIGTTIALRKNGGDADAYWRANWDVFAGKIIGTTRTLLSYMTGLALPNMEKTVLGLINHAFPQIPIQYSDYTGDFAKGDLANLEGEALEAALHAYLTDEVGELGETAEAEILRLYELYGNKALPGANAPTSVKEVDENGNEIERKPTLEELGNWDVNYRLTFIDAMGDIIGSETYNALGDAEKLKLIARANEYARDMAKEAAGIPVDLKGWKLDAKEAFDAGAPLADAILFYTRASVLTSDVDEEGNTVANSKARKVLELLDDIDIPDSQKRQLLRGELSDKANADLDALLDAGYSFADAVGMLHDEFTGERDVDVLTGYLADGFSPESARAMYEAVEALEPEDGKKQVSNAQELAAIAASNIPVADKWTAFAGTFGEDDTKALEKMEAVRAAGGTPDDYAELKANGQIDAYLRGIEAGFNPNTALRIVSAVAALPDLPEGESYDTSERQLAAVQACQTPEEQVKAYAMYGGADNAKTNEAKFTAALDFDVTPEMYLEARALAKASYDADGNGSLKQDEVVAALEAMDLTDRQRAALFQLFGSSWKKNPYGNTATIRDAYAAAKE